MIRRVASGILAIQLLFSGCALAANRTLAAEGDYVAQKNLNKPLAHWKLWHLRNGDYEVEENLAGPTHVVQVFRFDAQFVPSGFSLTIDSLPVKPGRSGKKPPRAILPTIISCRYTIENLSCDSENNGRKASPSIAAKPPYVLVPVDFYALDQTWLMTSICRFIEHKVAEGNVVDVYAMMDGKIYIGRPVQLTYAKNTTARVLGKEQPVTEYEVWMGGEDGAWTLNDLSTLQVTTDGLVASIRGKSNPELGYAIANYKEYERWPPHR